MNTERNRIDFIRGVAIFVMLWGHSIQYCCVNQFDFFENSLFKFIYSFHMPLFMLISGYLFFFSAQKREMIELIEYRSKSLLYPILVFSIIKHVLTIVLDVFIYKDFSSLFEAPSLVDLWFLWSVLACSFASSLAVKASHKSVVQFILLIVGFGMAAIFPCSTMNVFMYPFFVAGYFYAKNEKLLFKAHNTIGIISSIMFVIMLFFFEKKHFIYTTGIISGSFLESLTIDVYRWAIGLFGSFALVWLGTIVFNKFPRSKIINGLAILGKDSLAVYVLSVIFLSYALPVISEKLLSILPWINWNTHIWLYNLIVTPSVAILYSVLLTYLIRFLKSIKLYRLMFGR